MHNAFHVLCCPSTYTINIERCVVTSNSLIALKKPRFFEQCVVTQCTNEQRTLLCVKILLVYVMPYRNNVSQLLRHGTFNSVCAFPCPLPLWPEQVVGFHCQAFP